MLAELHPLQGTGSKGPGTYGKNGSRLCHLVVPEHQSCHQQALQLNIWSVLRRQEMGLIG
jgi:hypothetical protein